MNLMNVWMTKWSTHNLTLNLNWTHSSLVLHISLQSSQLATLFIFFRNLILLTLSLIHSAENLDVYTQYTYQPTTNAFGYSPFRIIAIEGCWDGVVGWSVVVGERQKIAGGGWREDIENNRKATLNMLLLNWLDYYSMVQSKSVEKIFYPYLEISSLKRQKMQSIKIDQLKVR